MLTLEEAEAFILKHGLLPSLTYYSNLNGVVQEYLDIFNKIHWELNQLYWNARGIDDKDERDILRYCLLKAALDVRRKHDHILRYKEYAVSHRFETSVGVLRMLTTLYYEYEQAIGVMF